MDITCSYCGSAVYSYDGPTPQAGEVIITKRFHGLRGYRDPQDGEAMKCPSCGAWWATVWHDGKGR